jgi:hypothetical protein
VHLGVCAAAGTASPRHRRPSSSRIITVCGSDVYGGIGGQSPARLV